MKTGGWIVAVLIVAFIILWYILKFTAYVFLGGIVLLLLIGAGMAIASMMRRKGG